MISANVRDMIPKIQTFMKDQPINKGWLFGSCSRGEDTSDSDVDILVQYSKDEQVTLFTISRIQERIEWVWHLLWLGSFVL